MGKFINQIGKVNKLSDKVNKSRRENKLKYIEPVIEEAILK